MATITLKSNLIETVGDLPAAGIDAPNFTLRATDLSDVDLNDYSGKKVVLNIFPSIDTDVCAMSVRRFNSEASANENTIVICISADLPFAHARFCGAEGLDNVISASTIGNPSFGKDYGVEMVTGPLSGMMSRAVVVVGVDGKVIYTEQVPEITQEPDYGAAIAVL